MNAFRRRITDVGEEVVACRGYGDDYIVGRDLEEAKVYPCVLPGEGVDVRVVELCVFCEEFVVVDSEVVVLVEE